MGQGKKAGQQVVARETRNGKRRRPGGPTCDPVPGPAPNRGCRLFIPPTAPAAARCRETPALEEDSWRRLVSGGREAQARAIAIVTQQSSANERQTRNQVQRRSTSSTSLAHWSPWLQHCAIGSGISHESNALETAGHHPAAGPLRLAPSARQAPILCSHGASQAADAGQSRGAGCLRGWQSADVGGRRRTGPPTAPACCCCLPQIYVPPHPLVKHWLAVMRSKETPSAIFRAAAAGESHLGSRAWRCTAGRGPSCRHRTLWLHQRAAMWHQPSAFLEASRCIPTASRN